jgi:electron transfer flavoprotein beta subunit
MKIAVCVKHVPCGRVRMQPDTLHVERDGPNELNDFDKYAIEEAVQIAEREQAEVVVVTVGPPDADESVRNALALGADRGVLVSDPSIAGSDLVATARVLTAALEREAPDLVLFGQQSKDGGGAVMWAAVAERLGRPFVSQAAEVFVAGGTVTVRRETEYGHDTIDAPLPAVVAVSDAINEPRYTSLKGRMAAKKKPVDVLTVADLGLAADDVGDAGSRTEVLSSAPPAARGNTVTVDDEAGAAEAIVAFLAERELV